MACKDCDVTGHILVGCLEILIGHSVSAGGVPEAEDSSSQLVGVRIILIKSDCRNTAVSCDERSYTLLDEWTEIGKRILSDCKPVVVRMGIDEA